MKGFQFLIISIIFYQSIVVSQAIQCADKKSECPDRTTCCLLPTKQWGCCPIERAVCCSDGEHCCPEGTTCNLREMTCENSTDSRRMVSWLETGLSTSGPTISERILLATNVECPDGSSCSDESTCCQTKSGRYGCCPRTNAVCCFDKEHCCPSGTECFSLGGNCHNYAADITKKTKWLKYYDSILKSPVICPDEESQCPEDTTCCEMSTGGYGCCPMPKAVCCDDKTHCCPSGTKCDIPQQKCTKGTISMPWSRKLSSRRMNDITCPDHVSHCPTGSTCCPISDTQYGCCPLPQAVCCEDKEHCCPTGTTCNVEQEACITARGNNFPWFKKFKPQVN